MVSSLSIQLASAGTGATIERGGNTTINWKVDNAPSCRGTTGYPTASDGIRASWEGTNRTAVGNTIFTSVLGNSAVAYPQTYTFTCNSRDTNGNIVATDSATLIVNDCTLPALWNSTTKRCVSGALTVPTPTVPASCVIANGDSTCSVLASWTTTNATGAYLWDKNVSEIKYTANSSTGSSVNIWGDPTLGTTFELMDGNGMVLDTKIVKVTCETGSAWNPSSNKCQPNNTGGTLSASPNPCTVAIGVSACSTGLTWSTTNTQSPKVYRGATLFSSSATGNNQPASVAYTGTTFTLKKSSGVSGQVDIATINRYASNRSLAFFANSLV